ncbi:hypothetical protein PQQ63_15435 [Paraburkholderia metrosideri]|uniref:Uncharacterized protein n=1 Tax=Paraburkholderia metrosideri TaxID=580937 RepID=A0ABW9DTZ6_9BURK
MTTFTVTTTETNGVTPDQKDHGIAAALAAYNADNPDAPLADAAAYIQFVVDAAAESYVRQYGIVS